MSDPDGPKVWPCLFDFYREIIASDLSMPDRMVALALLVHVDNRGKCFVSRPRIALEAACGISTASRALRTLFDAGWLVRTKGGTGTEVSYSQLAIPENKPDEEYQEFMRARRVRRGSTRSTRVVPDVDEGSAPGRQGVVPDVDDGGLPGAPRTTPRTTPLTTPLTNSRASALDAMHPEEIKPDELAETLPDYALGFGYYLGDPDPCPDSDLFTHWARSRSEAPDGAVGCMMSFAEARKYELEGAS
jgi:hypothetical protein